MFNHEVRVRYIVSVPYQIEDKAELHQVLH